MVLYTCPAGTHGAEVPLIAHPCGVAAQALERSGHSFTVKRVGGFKSIPLSRRGKREEIISLTGQQDVPVLLLDDGSTVQGSGAIVRWAAEHSAAQV
jgi:glutathione S-transferase